MEEENIIEISKWFPLATLYRPDGKQDYRFPSMTTQVINSPSWTEFDEFARDMIRTLTNQKVRMESVPVNKDKSNKSQQKKPWTLEENELPKNKYDRFRYGGQRFNLYGDAPITVKNGGNIKSSS